MKRILIVLLHLFVIVLLLPTVAHAALTTDVTQMLKYTYGAERLMYLASLEVVLWRILSKRKTPMFGRGQWILPIQTKNTGVFVGTAEGGTKSTRRAQPGTAEALFSLQEFYGVWNISWKLLQDARNDEASFARAVDFMDGGFKNRTLRLLNADLCGYGRGELGILPAADNQVTVTVRSLPFTDLGMIVDLMDDTDDNTTLGVAAQAVTQILVATREITTAGTAAGTAAGDYFSVADSVRTGGSLHTNGLLAWASDVNPKAVVGNLGGINRSTAGNEYWQASVLANGGTLRAFTEDLALQGMDLCRERGGVQITDLISNLAILRRYHESLRADTFFALQAVKAFGDKVGIGRSQDQMQDGEQSEGETVYQFSGIPWRAEPFLDANKIVGINREHLWIGHGENPVPRPISEIFDGQVPYYTSTTVTGFDVETYWQGELLCDMPTSLIRWDDIAEI